MNAVPTLKEELNRKTLETLEKLSNDRDYGRITEAQFAYGIDIIWSTTAGLVDTDLMLMMEMIQTRKSGSSFVTHEYYRTDKGHFVKVTNTHRGLVVVDAALFDGTHQSRKTYDFSDEPNPTRAALAKFKEVGDHLVAKGFSQM